jgi:hypothetical protein
MRNFNISRQFSQSPPPPLSLSLLLAADLIAIATVDFDNYLLESFGLCIGMKSVSSQ